ncbi:MAG: hypothetical protein R3B91_20320 [Planctomycetaceae bacterium]
MVSMIEQRRMPELPIASDGTMPVPVYDCHVILSAPDDNGIIHARVSTLPEVTASGQTERHILQSIVKDFKAALIRYREAGEDIRLEARSETASGETQRWIRCTCDFFNSTAVHCDWKQQ